MILWLCDWVVAWFWCFSIQRWCDFVHIAMLRLFDLHTCIREWLIPTTGWTEESKNVLATRMLCFLNRRFIFQTKKMCFSNGWYCFPKRMILFSTRMICFPHGRLVSHAVRAYRFVPATKPANFQGPILLFGRSTYNSCSTNEYFFPTGAYRVLFPRYSSPNVELQRLLYASHILVLNSACFSFVAFSFFEQICW